MARAPDFTPVNHDDEVINRVQDHLAKVLDPLVASPLNGAVLVKNIALVAGQTVVPHPLGRKPQGWFVVRQRVSVAPTDWVSVGATGAPAFTNGWVNYAGRQPARYKRDANGLVWVEGSIQNGTVGLSAFTLPVGFRPSNTQFYAERGNGIYCDVGFGNDGTVTPRDGTTNEANITAVFPVDTPSMLSVGDLLDYQAEDPTKVIRLTSPFPGTVDIIFF